MKDRAPRDTQTSLEERFTRIIAHIQDLQRTGLDGYSQYIREIGALKVELKKIQETGINLFASILLGTSPQTKVTIQMSDQDKKPMVARVYREKVLGKIEDIVGGGIAMMHNPRVICLKLSEIHLTDDGEIDEIDTTYVPLGAIKEITIMESQDMKMFKRS